MTDRNWIARRRTALRLALLAALAAAAVAAPLGPTGGDPAARAAGHEPKVHVARGLPYAPGAETVLDVYRTRRRGPAPAVLVVHGGGWRYGDKGRMARIARAFAHAGFVAFNMNYTLATAARPGFATQPRELRTAVRWIRRNAVRLRVDPARIGALGSSAGAHLVGLLAVQGGGPLVARSRIGAAVTWSAPFDLELVSPALRPPAESFLGCAIESCAERTAAASPVTHVSAGDPPMLLVHSEHEFIRVEHAHAMAARLVAEGVPHRLWILPGWAHGTDYARTALDRSIAFLHRQLD